MNPQALRYVLIYFSIWQSTRWIRFSRTFVEMVSNFQGRFPVHHSELKASLNVSYLIHVSHIPNFSWIHISVWQATSQCKRVFTLFKQTFSRLDCHHTTGAVQASHTYISCVELWAIIDVILYWPTDDCFEFCAPILRNLWFLFKFSSISLYEG